MNRRHFLSSALALAAAVPIAAQAQVKAEVTNGLRLTTSNPPEPGFTYTHGQRYRVFVNEGPLEKCVRVDQPAGKAWTVRFDRAKGGPLVISEVEHQGEIRLERIA